LRLQVETLQTQKVRVKPISFLQLLQRRQKLALASLMPCLRVQWNSRGEDTAIGSAPAGQAQARPLVVHGRAIKCHPGASDTTRDMIGITIGSYEIAEKIGSGGVADVYRASDPLLGRNVAIKFLREGLGDRPEVVERFQSEARTLAKLIHPNVALLYCLLREERHLGMVMEYVEGRTFAQILASSGRLEPERALPLVQQAIAGIDHAHQAGIVHRDIKASNLMLATNGGVKVMDFGIARCLGTDRATRQGHMVGTMQYMSPEQVRGDETDARSDVYALGVLLYELLGGELPFDSENDYQLCRAQIEDAPRPLRALVPDLSAPLEDVVLRALAKDPSQRFPGVRELGDALQDAWRRGALARRSAEREAPVTRELALEEAEQIALASTRSITPATSVRSVDAHALTRELRSPASECEPARPERGRGRIALAACGLLLIAFLFGVRLVRHEKRVETAASTRPSAAQPAAAVAAPVVAAPSAGGAKTASAAPIRKAAPAPRAAAAPSKSTEPAAESPRGEASWVIRRR